MKLCFLFKGKAVMMGSLINNHIKTLKGLHYKVDQVRFLMIPKDKCMTWNYYVIDYESLLTINALPSSRVQGFKL